MLVDAVAKLASVVVAPREELRVTSLVLFLICDFNLEGGRLCSFFPLTITFNECPCRLTVVAFVALIVLVCLSHGSVSELVKVAFGLGPIRR